MICLRINDLCWCRVCVIFSVAIVHYADIVVLGFSRVLLRCMFFLLAQFKFLLMCVLCVYGFLCFFSSLFRWCFFKCGRPFTSCLSAVVLCVFYKCTNYVCWCICVRLCVCGNVVG